MDCTLFIVAVVGAVIILVAMIAFIIRWIVEERKNHKKNKELEEDASLYKSVA